MDFELNLHMDLRNFKLILIFNLNGFTTMHYVIHLVPTLRYRLDCLEPDTGLCGRISVSSLMVVSCQQFSAGHMGNRHLLSL